MSYSPAYGVLSLIGLWIHYSPDYGVLKFQGKYSVLILPVAWYSVPCIHMYIALIVVYLYMASNLGFSSLYTCGVYLLVLVFGVQVEVFLLLPF